MKRIFPYFLWCICLVYTSLDAFKVVDEDSSICTFISFSLHSACKGLIFMISAFVPASKFNLKYYLLINLLTYVYLGQGHVVEFRQTSIIISYLSFKAVVITGMYHDTL